MTQHQQCFLSMTRRYFFLCPNKCRIYLPTGKRLLREAQPRQGGAGLGCGISYMGEERITSFTKLNAWRESHQLVLLIYKASKNFPNEELFALTSQIRRAAVSITSNLAEGFSRNSWKEKLQFYSTAMGSLTEVENQLLIARDVGYISNSEFKQLANRAVRAGKLMTGLIKKSKSMI